jgi:hypothetical protein
MKTKIIALLCSIPFLLMVSLSSFAQIPSSPVPVAGPTSVVMPTTSSLYYVPPQDPSITLTWSVSPTSAGTFGPTSNSATVTWNSAFTGNVVISCTAKNTKGTSAPATLSVSVTASPLTAVTISPSSQKISYNTAAAALSATTQGGSGTFSYQWQSSPGSTTYTNISGATTATYSPGILTSTTSYQLIVTNNSTSVTSNIATVFVNPVSTEQFTYTADSLFLHLSKSAIPTGILYDRVFPATSLNNVNVNEIDTTNHPYFLKAYSEMFNSAYSQAGWLPADSITSRAAATRVQPGTNNVPVGLSFYSYNVIDLNAITNNLIQMHSDSLYYDTPNRTTSPYDLVNSFVASPLLDSVNAQSTVQFVFPANLFINKSGLTMSSLKVDFGDGLGQVSVSLGSSHNVTYSGPDGFRNLLFVATMSNGTVYQTYGQIKVYSTPNSNAAMVKTAAVQATCSYSDYTPSIFPSALGFQGYDENMAVPGNGQISISYATNPCTGILKKPIIISEYFQPGGMSNSDLYAYFNKNTFMYNSIGLLDYLKSQGFDIVTVTYQANTNVSDGSTDYIERNGRVLMTAINMVNQMKQGTAQNILIGPSMGGLVSRYALTYMEQHNQTHQVGLWVSFDAPHQGANIPLGDQEFAQKASDLSPLAGTALNQQANNPAAKEMLISHYLANKSGPGGAPGFRDRFNSVITTMGYPKGDTGQPFRKIAIADGSLGGNEVVADGSVAFTFQAADIRIVNLLLFKVRINFFTAAQAQVNFEPSAGSTAPIFAFKGVKWLPEIKNYTTPSYTSSLDGAPGGTFYTQQTIAGFGGITVAKFAFVNIKTYFSSVQNNHSFINTKSALGFQGSNQNLSENMSGRNLVCTGETPFDSYFAPLNTNYEHINLWPAAANFLVQEISGNQQAPSVLNPTTTTFTINGPTSICGGSGTYSINSLPAGATVTWSASPATAVTLTPSGQGVVVTSLGSSFTSVTLNANVVTKCLPTAVTPFIIELSTAPPPPINGPSSVCAGVNYENTFTAPTVPGATGWTWSSMPSANFYGNSKTSSSAVLNFTNAGTYSLECDITTPCGLVKAYGQFYASSTCSTTNAAFAVYPNPSSSVMSVGPANTTSSDATSVNQTQTSTPFTYELYDSKGKILRQGQSKDGSTVQFDTSTLTSDMYYVHIIYGSTVIEKKVIVSH